MNRATKHVTLTGMPEKEIAARVLNKIPDIIAVYLFGSRARGDANSGSDTDVAVLAAHPLEPILRWHLQEELAGFLGHDVDLVDLRGASTVMRVQVLKDARVLFESSGYARAIFEATAFSAYAHLQEARRNILEDIAKRGHIYG